MTIKIKGTNKFTHAPTYNVRLAVCGGSFYIYRKSFINYRRNNEKL